MTAMHKVIEEIANDHEIKDEVKFSMLGQVFIMIAENEELNQTGLLDKVISEMTKLYKEKTK
jgi:hypothetical protein